MFSIKSSILTPPIAQTGCFDIFAKYEILEPIKYNTKVKTGDIIAKLKNRNIVTPFDGIIGKRDFSNDIDVSKINIEEFVAEIPTIIANYYHGEVFGLTDSDGVGKLAGNSGRQNHFS